MAIRKTMEVNIKNSSRNVSEFIIYKAAFAMGMLIVSCILIKVLMDGDSLWLLVLIPFFTLLTMCFDAFVIPYKKTDDGIIFDHFWRTSYLKDCEVKRLKMFHEGASIIGISDFSIFVTAKNHFGYYQFVADDENGLHEYYYNLGLIKRKPYPRSEHSK